MKIKVFKNNLVKNIQNVQNVISSKINLPILSNILIQAQKDTVRLTSTDLDIGISSSFTSEVEEEGALTVPAKRFNEIIKELPDEDIMISTMKNNSMMIKCSKCFFKILGLPEEDFPKLPEFQKEPHVIMEQKALKNMLAMTHFSMSHDETRYVLNGALFLFKPNQLTTVTTDGKRLSLVKKNIGPSALDKALIIPSKTIYELSRALEEDGEVKITLSENQAKFELNNITVISRLIEGSYPNHEQVIPKEVKDKLKVPREQLLLAVRRVALLTTPDSQSIKIDILKNKIILSKSSANIGEAREEIEADYKGNEVTVGFNPAYLADILKAIPVEEPEIEIMGPDKPAVVRIEDWCVYLVLPMQLA